MALASTSPVCRFHPLDDSTPCSTTAGTDPENLKHVFYTFSTDGGGTSPPRSACPRNRAAVVAAARSSFTTLDVTVEDLIPGADRAVARLQWAGLRPDGQVSRQTLEIVRIEDGMAIEHWGGRS